MTSLEGAVRRLQDACRDARDEAKELREENKRLLSIIENAGLDSRRWERSPAHAPLPDNLHPSYHSALSNPPSIRGSPNNHPPEFGIAYAAPGVLAPPSKSPIPNEQQQSDSYFSGYPSGGPRSGPDPNTVFHPDTFVPTANPIGAPEFIPTTTTATGGQHAHQVSLENQFVDYRPGSASGSDSSAPHPLYTHEANDGLSDRSSMSEPSPGVAHTPLQLGFNNLNIFSPMAPLPMDYGAGGGGDPNRQAAAWDSAFYSASTFQPQPQPENETELGRSDTVKASNYAALNRNGSRGSHHRRAFSSADLLDPVHQQNEMFVDEAPYEFERYDFGQSRPPSSASSGLSHGGEVGHNPVTNPGLTRSRSRRHSFPASLSSPGDPADESEDQDMEHEVFPDLNNIGRGVQVGLPPSDPGMSNTLAVIKAQAFGTVRKSRVRAKRPGADSAAKVAMEVLQARGLGLGLDVDLDVSGSSISAARRRARKEEPS